MSGGSYDYLYYAEPDELISHKLTLEQMADRLTSLNYAEDAARETLELLQIVKQYEIRAYVITDRISKVWRAVEWWDSGDSNEDQLKEALKEYRTPMI